MPEQLPLPGLEAAPQPTDRLFFAIVPDAATAARIARLAQRLRGLHGLRGRPLAADRLHVTLHFLGDHAGLPLQLVADASAAAASVAVPAFDVAFDRAASFLRPRNAPLVLRGGDGLVALTALQRALGAALQAAGLLHAAAVRFTPHVTLLYDDRQVIDEPVDTIAWTVREFVLIDSLIGQGRHVPLARWSLTTAP
jgi:RNA 2',3'-cyclic 3'-phosphodiesterase